MKELSATRVLRDPKKIRRRKRVFSSDRRISKTAIKIMKVLMSMADSSREVEASKYDIMARISISDPYPTLRVLLNKGYLEKIGEGKTGSNVYRILIVDV